MVKLAAMLLFLLLAACASTPPKPVCTRLYATDLFTKLVDSMTANIRKMPDDGHVSVVERARADAMLAKVEELKEVYLDEENEKLCAEVRKVAAKYNFKIE
jgi:hypothetical protein